VEVERLLRHARPRRALQLLFRRGRGPRLGGRRLALAHAPRPGERGGMRQILMSLPGAAAAEVWRLPLRPDAGQRESPGVRRGPFPHAPLEYARRSSANPHAPLSQRGLTMLTRKPPLLAPALLLLALTGVTGAASQGGQPWVVYEGSEGAGKGKHI